MFVQNTGSKKAYTPALPLVLQNVQTPSPAENFTLTINFTDDSFPNYVEKYTILFQVSC